VISRDYRTLRPPFGRARPDAVGHRTNEIDEAVLGTILSWRDARSTVGTQTRSRERSRAETDDASPRFVRGRSGAALGLRPAVASHMSIKRPVHPLLIALPLAAFAVVLIALLVHAVTGDVAWYRVALFANLGGLFVALLSTLAGMVDAANLPAFTVAREAGLRHVAYNALGLIFFAATAAVIYNRYEGHHMLGDAAPLALGALGLTSMVIAGWYGRVVLIAFELGQTIVRYPARMLARTPAPPHRRSIPTIG
jgi:uncharacterized membrane protein